MLAESVELAGCRQPRLIRRSKIFTSVLARVSIAVKCRLPGHACPRYGTSAMAAVAQYVSAGRCRSLHTI
jgi:hypothetical protein